MTTTPTGKRVLIIEDEVSLRNALHDKLEREGLTVLECKNGAEGLMVALREHPDLILLDLIMPVMGGVTMLKKLREDAWGKSALVFILTNLVSDNEQRNRDISEAKPTYYMVKTDWKIMDVVSKVKESLGL